MTSPTAWHDELWFDCHACDWGDCTGRRGCKGNELTARIAELEAENTRWAVRATERQDRLATLTAAARAVLDSGVWESSPGGWTVPQAEWDALDAALAEPSGE